jgi:hypothetical protein
MRKPLRSQKGLVLLLSWRHFVCFSAVSQFSLPCSKEVMAGDAAAAPQPTAEELEFFIDSARYGDVGDVIAALAEGVPVDVVDSARRTGVLQRCNRRAACRMRLSPPTNNV